MFSAAAAACSSLSISPGYIVARMAMSAMHWYHTSPPPGDRHAPPLLLIAGCRRVSGSTL